MAQSNWASKTCGNCGFVSPNDLPKFHCKVCDTDKCPVCAGGDQDDNGDVEYCTPCGMATLPAVLKGDLP